MLPSIRWSIALSLVVASVSLGQPMLSVTDVGLNGSNNREWLVEITPDATLFVDTVQGNGGSIAAEIGFEVTAGSLVGAVANAIDYPVNTPGNNPFTSSVSFGVAADTVNNSLFASLGSIFFTDASPRELLTIETLGSGSTTLSWGGQTLLPGTADSYIGGRIAQEGVDYDEYQGTLSSGGGNPLGDFNSDSMWDCADIDALIGEIASGTNNLSFDMDGDGMVDTSDRDEWLAVAGSQNLPNGNAYLMGDASLDGVVDVSDFNLWNSNKFTNTPAWCSGDFNADGVVDVSDFNVWNGNKFQSSDVSTVPEPSTFVLSTLTMFAILFVGRKRR